MLQAPQMHATWVNSVIVLMTSMAEHGWFAKGGVHREATLCRQVKFQDIENISDALLNSSQWCYQERVCSLTTAPPAMARSARSLTAPTAGPLRCFPAATSAFDVLLGVLQRSACPVTCISSPDAIG